MAVPYAVVPAGSSSKAFPAASRSPSRSMMSADGAPRAKEMRSDGGMRSRLPTEDLDGEARDLGRRAADLHALRLQRLGLRGGRALRARDDRAGVAHRLARRRGEARDVGDDRLGHVGLDELGSALLGVAADLARQHDELGLRVLLEEAEDVDERRARDRVAADADDRRVAEAA